MKYLVLLTLLLPGNHLFSQNYDSVEFKKVQINGIFLGSAKKLILDTMGKPQKITKYDNESNEDSWSEYHYGANIIDILPKGTFRGFNIKTKSLILSYGNLKVKVGDPLDALAKTFPRSFATMKKENSKLFRLRFNRSDNYLIFHTEGGVVRSFETWQEL